MTTTYGPTLMKRLLGEKIKNLREAAGLRMSDAARALHCDTSMISRIETGQSGIKYSDLKLLCEVYGAPHLEDELESIRESAHVRGWWTSYKLPGWLQLYVGLENDSILMQRFVLELVPGLLQTEEYAREVTRLDGSSSEDLTRHVAARLGRQRLLSNPEFTLDVVMSEALLWRTASMGGVGLDQMQRLHDAATEPNVSIRVLPFAAGAHSSMLSSFTLLNFPPGTIGTVVSQELAEGNSLGDDPKLVQHLQATFDDLRDQAVDPDETGSLIQGFIQRSKEEANA